MVITTTNIEKMPKDFKNNYIIKVFIEICNKVFPLKLEQEYANLANLFFKFANESSLLVKSNNELNEHSDEIVYFKKVEARKVEKFYQLLESLKSLNIEEPTTIEELQRVKKDFETFESSIINSQRLNHISFENMYDSSRITAKESRERLNSLIPQIKNSLDAIAKFDFTSERRIDRLNIFSYHFEEIDNIEGLSQNKKELLKKLLVSYTNMRIGAFKVVEELIFEVLSLYNNRQIIDLYDHSEQLHDKFTTLAHALYTLDESFYNCLEHMVTSNGQLLETISTLFQENTIKIVSWFGDYFNNKEIDIDELARCSRDNCVYYCDKEALMGLLNSKKLRTKKSGVSK